MVDRRHQPLDKLNLDNVGLDDLIAPNFKVFELTRSGLAHRHGIPNDFTTVEQLHAAVNLAREVMQPIRKKFGRFTPNSVFRSQALERGLKHKPTGWVSTSQHTRGCACDVEIPGVTTLNLATWARDNLPDFDQIICECYDPAKGPNSGWVHISLLPPGQGVNRKEVLSFVRDPESKRMVYVRGLWGTTVA